MDYLFLASIGPVQGFIASARRTRDLQFGSWLLSELAKAAAKKIEDNNGPHSLIFPAPNLEDKEALTPYSQLNVANKIVARISQSPQELGEQVRWVIFEQLHAIRDEAYNNEIRGNYNRGNAYAQIDDLVEYFWVALPFEENDYAGRRLQLENLMAARKNTRNFRQGTWGDAQFKSSIDGQLESVIPEDKYPRRGDTDEAKIRKVKALYQDYGAGPTEYLSGVDLLKRKGATEKPGASSPDNSFPESSFPSTSHMAAIPFLKRLEHLSDPDKNQAKALWQTYIEEVKQVSGGRLERIPRKSRSHPILDRVEGSLLFEERLVDLLDFVVGTDTAQFREVKEKLRKFFAFLDEKLGKARPNPYYAILHADGDRMGKVIDSLASAPKGDEKHRELSQALDTFARNVHDIIKKYDGALVYAGGDDVLAFMPLDTALQCAHELASTFSESLKRFTEDEGHSPTLSVGLAIVHHLHHLADALNISRAAEKRAKDVEGKNALAITVRKRSGEDYTVAEQWNVLDRDLEALINYYLENAIPVGTAYELRNMLLRLNAPKGEPGYWFLQSAIQADTVRILQRKLGVPQQKFKQQGEEKKEEILKTLFAMLDIKTPLEPIEERDNIKPPSVYIERFINELLVAQVFADARKLVDPSKEKKNDRLDH